MQDAVCHGATYNAEPAAEFGKGFALSRKGFCCEITLQEFYVQAMFKQNIL